MIRFRQKDFTKARLNGLTRMKRLALTKLERGRRFVKTEATKAAMNPGKYTSDSIKFVAENPATAASTAVPIPGSSLVVNRGENYVKNKVGVYNKFTKGLGTIYEKSGLPKVVEPAVNTVVNSTKYL
jgi:hypothetical protein